MRQIVMLVAPLLVASGCRSRDTRPPGYRVPPGFSIEAAASSARLGPLAGFTFDSRGRPVVFRERGFAMLLADNNGDGIFETERVLTTQVSSVRGIWLDGRVLYLLGNGPDGQYGLYRSEDRDRDDQMEELEQLSQFEASAPGSHEMRRGPDGALTLLQGGRWLRWNEERRNVTVLASGFANPRALAYDRDGEAFVLDGGARTVHAVVGGDYSEPSYHFDVLPPMREAAVTGLEFYQDRAYPEAFRDALFQAAGPRGRIVARRVMRSGATYRLDETPVAEFVAGEGFTVTDLKVGPDGFVYFTTSRPGGLFRIRYERPSRAPGGVTAIVQQPQPLSAWGHATLQRQRELLEARWGEELETLARRTGAPAADRVQAVLLLQRFGPKPKIPLLKTLLGDAEPRVRAAAVYVGGDALAGAGLKDRDPLVRRRAAEALDNAYKPQIYPLLGDGDRFVRYAARVALEEMPRDEWKARVMEEENPRLAIEGMLALVRTGSGERPEILAKLLPMSGDLDALRLFTLASAGVKDGGLRRRAAEVLLSQFPAAGDEKRSRELASALAWCGGSEVIQKILDALVKTGENEPLRLHYAQCLRSIKDGWTNEQRKALLALSIASESVDRQRIFDLQMKTAPQIGNVREGRAIFEKQCAECHRFGPDLAGVAKRFDRAALLEAILWPSRDVPEKYQSVVLELADGSTIEGLVVREDEKTLLLKTASEANPISILKSRVMDQRNSEKSLMPDGLLDGYDRRTIASLLAYLQTL